MQMETTLREPPAQPNATPCVEVALVGTGGFAARLTYAVPDDLAHGVRRGACVVVPLGARRVTGVVLGPPDGPPLSTLRPIAELLDQGLPTELLELVFWAARYYQTSPGTFLQSAVPPALRAKRRRQVRRAAPGELAGQSRDGPADLGALDRRILARLPEAGLDLELLRREIGPALQAALRRLRSRGLVVVEDVAVQERPELPDVCAMEAPPDPAPSFRRATRQAEVYAYLAERRPQAVSRAELAARFAGAAATVARLVKQGLAREVPHAAELRPAASPHPATVKRSLHPAQADALQAICAAFGDFATFLLFGVTGSGKTEVYLRAAEAARSTGRGVLFLVPEIALTHQLVAELTLRFAGSVAVLHSGLSDQERRRAWRDIAQAATPVVVGARSAVFAPLPDLGLIVVDEEHDPAYKQEEAPRYNARDLAVMRGKLAACPVVLCSATPSLESYHAALGGKYKLLRLAERANLAPMPAVEIIDLRQERRRLESEAGASTGRLDALPLSPPLEAALLETYRAGEQALLFLNRRGFSRFIQCPACGHVETCPDCSVSLTVHRVRHAAICHHCGYARPPASRCPSCDGVLAAKSFGTEQIEAAVRALVPAARIARLDRDTSERVGFVRRTVHAWRAGELDVLVGTQMIAKGHDVPGVTLIGVILADASLNFPDFRAAERTFQLLAQVAGRAGRGSKPGRVLVQTYQPSHASLVAASQHDFESFAGQELPLRSELGYPPFGRLTRIVVEGPAHAIDARAEEIASSLRRAAAALDPIQARSVEVLGPAPAPIEKLRGRHRVQLLVKSAQHRTRAQVLSAALRQESPVAKKQRDGSPAQPVRVVVDVDPINML
jgi:primosomal protein N' (replication factor Y)